MNSNWIVLAVGVAGAIVMFATTRLLRNRVVDFGTVSYQWIAEQRLSQGHDPQR